MNRTMLASAALMGLILTGSAWGVHTFQKFEDFATDPGWIGVNNRPAAGLGQDYGWSNTNNAGGAAAGEAGGTIGRASSAPGVLPGSYYAADLGGTTDFNHAFSASGKAFLPAIGSNNDPTAAFLGFFDSNGACFGSACTGGGSSTQAVLAGWFIDFNNTFMAWEGPGGGVFSTAGTAGTPTGILDWSINYDPSTGNGEISGQFGSIVLGATDIGTGARGSGATFDRFGMGGGTDTAFGNSGPFYIDDVTYTAVPEPALAGMLACMGLLAVRRMRRRR